MREDIREEEQGKEMQGELPAWVEVNMKGWNWDHLGEQGCQVGAEGGQEEDLAHDLKFRIKIYEKILTKFN